MTEERISNIISESIDLLIESKKNIHIKKKNKGKFNALKKKTGKSTEELTHSKNPLTRKRAIFAKNAKKWHHKGKKKVNESIITEGKIETWQPDEVVSWDNAQYYCNHNYETVDRNMARCDKLGIPEDERCFFCQKPLKGGYKVLYGCNDNSDADYYAQPNETHSMPVKIGKTCAKAFENAHKDKYGH
jgi:hypothetical protein